VFVPLKRATILLATPKQGNEHLFIVLTNPNKAKEVLIINITSSDKFYDKSCVLEKGDHSFIKHKSYIAYRYCNIIHADKLKDLVIRTYEPINQETLDRIVKGLYKSRHTKQKVKTFYTNSLE
jgi:hypothetical protein